MQGSVPKPSISPVPSAAHIRTTWKGSSDHIAVNVDSESSRLIEREEAVEDKGLQLKGSEFLWSSVISSIR